MSLFTYAITGLSVLVGVMWLGFGSEMAKSFYNIIVKDKWETWLTHLKHVDKHAKKGLEALLMNCPFCHQEIPDQDIARHLAHKGGSVRSVAKLHASRRNARVRWERVRQQTIERDEEKVK